MKRRYPIIDMHRTGKKIKQLMQVRGLTVREIQEYLGLAAPQSIYHWFDGRNLPTVDNLYALSKLFQVPVDSMLCEECEEISVSQTGEEMLSFHAVSAGDKEKNPLSWGNIICLTPNIRLGRDGEEITYSREYQRYKRLSVYAYHLAASSCG